jgi:hypothetical protein
MNQEMMITLQQVLNSLESPAFICDEKSVILVNDIFMAEKYEKTFCKDYWEKRNFTFQKTKINDCLYLCQIMPDEIKMLKTCTRQLAQAVNLL